MTTGDTIYERALALARARGVRSNAHNGHSLYRYNDSRDYLRILACTDGALMIYLGDRFAFQRRLTGVCEAYNGAEVPLAEALAQEVSI